MTAVGSPALILAGVFGSLSEYSVKGSLCLLLFVPAVPSSYSLSLEFDDDVFDDGSVVILVSSSTSFVASRTASFTSFAFSLNLSLALRS